MTKVVEEKKDVKTFELVSFTTNAEKRMVNYSYPLHIKEDKKAEFAEFYNYLTALAMSKKLSSDIMSITEKIDNNDDEVKREKFDIKLAELTSQFNCYEEHLKGMNTSDITDKINALPECDRRYIQTLMFGDGHKTFLDENIGIDIKELHRVALNLDVKTVQTECNVFMKKWVYTTKDSILFKPHRGKARAEQVDSLLKRCDVLNKRQHTNNIKGDRMGLNAFKDYFLAIALWDTLHKLNGVDLFDVVAEKDEN